MARLWLDFVNAEDALGSFDAYVTWLEQVTLLDAERGTTLRRRALLQPAGATAALMEARRIRAALHALAERGSATDKARALAVGELNRVLQRSAGTRRIDLLDDGGFARTFIASGDAFAGLLIPLVESATDSLVRGELNRVRRCANPRCHHVFFDTTRNGSRRWCAMGGCGNRAKAARFRKRTKNQ